MNRLRRLSIIVSILNSLKQITTKDLQIKVSAMLGEPVCKSTIEKDLFTLRMDFDCELKSSKQGVMLIEQVDFLDRIKNYLNII